MKKALMNASVASMIYKFNMDNIDILENLGYKVDVACNFGKENPISNEEIDKFRSILKEKDIYVYETECPRNIFALDKMIKTYKQLKKLIDDGEYDLIHTQSPIGGVVCRLAARKARKRGTKVIYEAHGFHFYKGAPIQNWIFFYPIEKICSRLTDLIITINKEDYKRAKKLHAKKVEYVPGIGVHTEEFQNVVVDRNRKRSELGFKDDDFIFMSTGQLSVRKNHEIIIKALSMIENSQIKYLIVGFGELEEYLKNLAKQLKVEERVVFAGYRSDVKELLHVVDAFAFPSLQEGLPVSLMEAMAAGLPIVCSRIRGNVDLIEDEKNGYLVEPYDFKGFKNSMEHISSYPLENLKIMNNNIMQNFDIIHVNEKMNEIYSKRD